MTDARQSVTTLKDLLAEASARLAGLAAPAAERLQREIDELQQSIDEGDRPTAEIEQKIVSVRVMAEIEQSRSGQRSS